MSQGRAWPRPRPESVDAAEDDRGGRGVREGTAADDRGKQKRARRILRTPPRTPLMTFFFRSSRQSFAPRQDWHAACVATTIATATAIATAIATATVTARRPRFRCLRVTAMASATAAAVATATATAAAAATATAMAETAAAATAAATATTVV